MCKLRNEYIYNNQVSWLERWFAIKNSLFVKSIQLLNVSIFLSITSHTFHREGFEEGIKNSITSISSSMLHNHLTWRLITVLQHKSLMMWNNKKIAGNTHQINSICVERKLTFQIYTFPSELGIVWFKIYFRKYRKIYY